MIRIVNRSAFGGSIVNGYKGVVMLYDDLEFGPYDTAEQKARMAFELYEDGKMSQALSELETALEINPASSPLHFNKALTLDSMSQLAGHYITSERYSEAEALLLKVIAAQRATLDPHHLSISISISNLALLYGHRGEFAKAEPLFAEALDIQRATLGVRHQTTQKTMYALAWLLLRARPESLRDPERVLRLAEAVLIEVPV